MVFMLMSICMSVGTFNSMDGVPDADSLRDYGDGVNYFDPQFLALHKEYAQQLLTHTNPYTGKSLVNDPVMAVIEITNENSLYRYWRGGELKPFAGGGILTIRHTKMLDSLWVSYLISKYSNTSALANAWGSSSGMNELVNGTFEDTPPLTGWAMETQPSASASVFQDPIEKNSGTYSAKIIVSLSDGTDWHVQWIGYASRIPS